MKKLKKIFTYKIIKILIGLLIILILFLIYAHNFGSKGLIVKEYIIEDDNIPEAFTGESIVHFTDLHYGKSTSVDELKTVVFKINGYNPAIVIFTGDLIDRATDLNATDKNNLIDELSKIDASLGKYVIIGNHDYEFTDFEFIMKQSGFIFIKNNYEIVYNKSYEPILIYGTDSLIKGSPSFEKLNTLLDSIDEEYSKLSSLDYTEEEKLIIENDIINPKYRILAVHEPDQLIDFDNSRYNFNIAIAGHSHNGQVRIPIFGALITPPGAKKYYLPKYEFEDLDLYISSGLGTTILSMRLLNKPSFNVYRLK